MRALERALNNYRQHEQEYRDELASIRWAIEFLLEFASESPSNKTLAPAVVDLLEREALIERALRRPVLPPIPEELRNPFTRPRTLEETAYIKGLIKKYSGKRVKTVPPVD